MYLDGLLIVEGKSDEAFIKSFLECDVYKTNGFDIKEEDILFLKEVSKSRKIIILTDPDKAGHQIRQKINECIRNTYNINIDIELCNKHGKHGVAEANKKAILDALQEYIIDERPKENNIEAYQLINLGLNNKNKREYICKTFHLGKCNTKAMIERINILKIDIKEIRKALEKYGN